VFDWYLKELKIAELKILLLIIRQTLGWEENKKTKERKQSDWLSSSQLVLKTNCSPRAINSAIQTLIDKNLIAVAGESGEILDTPSKRKGKQKLFYRFTCANFADVETEGKTDKKQGRTELASAIFAEDLRRNCVALAQKMRYTK
jgi:hypothetical protein